MRASAALVALVGALAACSSGAGDTADTIGPAPSRPETVATLAFRPVLQDGLPCDDAEGLDPATVLPYEEPATVCAVVGPGDGLDLARVTAELGGATGGEWVVTVEVAQRDRQTANDRFNACAALDPTCPTGALAIVIDDIIITAPTVQSRDVADGPIVVSGGGPDGYTRAEAEELADRLGG